MASPRSGRSASNMQSGESRDRWRRGVLAAQGAYYVFVGLWSLIHFGSFARVAAARMSPFQAQTFGAVLVVLGASFLEATRREPPQAFPSLLGASVAAAIALVSFWWLPRLGLASGLWADLLLEVAFALTLILLYPRSQRERPRTPTRRR